jgi:glycogen debranching enzyme
MGSPREDHEANEDLERRGRILTKTSPAASLSIADAFVLKDGDVFLVTEPTGDIPEDGPHGFGLYHHDCRFLNGYVLEIDGREPIPLVANAAHGHKGVVELTNPELPKRGGGTLEMHEIALCWQRFLDGERSRLHDVLRVRNFHDEAVDLVLTLRFRAEFEDVFDVRGLLSNGHGKLHPPRWAHQSLRLQYDGSDGIQRTTDIHFWRRPDEIDGCTVRFSLHVESETEQEIALSIHLHESSAKEKLEAPAARPDLPLIDRSRRAVAAAHASAFTVVHSDYVPLARAMERSICDLSMLRSSLAHEAFYAAGIPWFAALFGRDAIIVALEALAYNPDIARDTLRLLARHQGKKVDPSRDEEPGKILHELRVGELAHLGAVPHTPYYGTVDATPLFLVLLAHHAAWTGQLDLFRELRPNVDAALGWVARYGEAEMPGYVAYRSHATNGLANQGWKDSGDAIVMENGDLAQQPIALVEVQGYVYLAKMGIADLLDRTGEKDLAGRLRGEAEDLKQRFVRDFWLADKGFFALALTAGGPAAVLSSNPGQALWTGIVPPEEARRTMECLLSEPMWSGWGIRTLSSDARRFNPVAYHRGTVWPHDNAIIAAGFRRHGFDHEACQVFDGILDASTHFGMHRLPELFSGFRRSDYGVPVRYPVACHPQAWAAGALPFMLSNALGLTPEAFDKRLRIVRPRLPEAVHCVSLRGLRVGGAAVDLSFARRRSGRISVRVLRNDGGLAVEVE